MDAIINKAIENKQRGLSEYESKLVLKTAGVKIAKEILVHSKEEAIKAADEIGSPVVLKGCSHELIHKTDLGMVRPGILNDTDLSLKYDEITAVDIKLEGVLIQKTISGKREFVIGLHRDPQFGPCVMFGLGGIYTEVLKDAVFRVAPLTEEDAAEMIGEIKAKELLGDFRGDVAVDKEALIKALVGLGDLGVKYESISEIDINPVIITEGDPVAVDGLIVLAR